MPHKIIDLRSDTVTRPTPAMYAAMQTAVLGDDVLGDDPTVIELEVESAKIMGKEAGLFVPSGSMGNQICLAVQTNPGESAIFEDEAHMIYYEAGAPGVIAQIICRTVVGKDGVMDPEKLEAKITAGSLHTPRTSIVCVENTHNRAGGAVIPMDYLRAYRALTLKHGIKLHMDGARVFNASAQLGIDVKEIADTCDTMSFCLSKALGAPVGSVIVGSSEFIEKARLWRKRLGGGMRQSGLLAACGLVGLRSMRDRLHEDHSRAKTLAKQLNELPGLVVDLEKRSTNFVMVETEKPASEWIEKLAEQNVLAMAFNPHLLRLITHYDVDDAEIVQTVNVFSSLAYSSLQSSTN